MAGMSWRQFVEHVEYEIRKQGGSPENLLVGSIDVNLPDGKPHLNVPLVSIEINEQLTSLLIVYDSAY